MTNWRLLAGVVLTLGLIGLLTVCLLYGLTGGDIPFDHGIVVDAGSSHSQVTLYKWHGDKYKGTGCVTELDTCGVDDGLSSFRNPIQAGESLLPCLKSVSNNIPVEKRTTSPVFLGATAGMRLINITNSHQQVAIFIAVKCAMEKMALDVRDVGIIDGGSEGLFAWVTTNFLLGILQKGKHSTVGALDLGGASTQVAFEVEAEHIATPNVVTRKLYGEEYHVYSVSYLCYGIFETYRRYLAVIADNPDRTDIIDHPCAPRGLMFEHNADFLFNQPCTLTKEYKKWVTLYPEKLNQNYTFKGTGDVAKCKSIMSEVYENCKFNDCFKPVNSSIMPKTFMAFSAYFYTMVYFNSTKTSFDNFTKTLDEFCAMDWEDAQNITTPEADSRLIYRYCFQGQAISHLLTSGYGFDADTWSNIQFTKKVNKTSVGWSLGYMIDATYAIPAEKPNPPIISLALFIIVLLISVILCILFFVFFSRHRRYKKKMTATSVAA